MFTHFLDCLTFAYEAHQTQFKEAVRRWDKLTPYAMHPIWCAMTLLSETNLPAEIREIGFQALCFHDVKENTGFSLPAWTHPRAMELVDEMSFETSADEFELIWKRSDLCKLFKIYDKVSNLLDGSWMPDEKWNKYCDLVHRLVEFVEQKYGELNIVKIARAIAIRRSQNE